MINPIKSSVLWSEQAIVHLIIDFRLVFWMQKKLDKWDLYSAIKDKSDNEKM